MECVDCGHSGPSVEVRLCPWALELDFEEREVTLCEACYDQRAMDT